MFHHNDNLRSKLSRSKGSYLILNINLKSKFDSKYSFKTHFRLLITKMQRNDVVAVCDLEERPKNPYLSKQYFYEFVDKGTIQIQNFKT